MHELRAPKRAFDGICFGPLSYLWLAAILVGGCSKAVDDGKAPVSGKVTYKGQPVEGATVSFLSSDIGSSPGAAMTAADGAYSLRVKPGAFTVMVSKVETPVSTQEVSMEEAMANADKPPAQPKELLPAKYQDQAQSPLKCEVKAGPANTFDISLSD